MICRAVMYFFHLGPYATSAPRIAHNFGSTIRDDSTACRPAVLNAVSVPRLAYCVHRPVVSHAIPMPHSARA
eukprot:902588-Rhodomonas_salina.1